MAAALDWKEQKRGRGLDTGLFFVKFASRAGV